MKFLDRAELLLESWDGQPDVSSTAGYSLAVVVAAALAAVERETIQQASWYAEGAGSPEIAAGLLGLVSIQANDKGDKECSGGSSSPQSSSGTSTTSCDPSSDVASKVCAHGSLSPGCPLCYEAACECPEPFLEHGRACPAAPKPFGERTQTAMSEGELKGLRDMAAHFKAKEPMGPLGNILDACVAEIERLRSAAPADDALKAAWDKAIESAAKECEQQAEVDENAPYTSAEGVAKGKLCAFTLRSIADEIRELKYEPTAQSRPDSVTEMRAALEDILAKSKDNWAAARAERGLGRGKVGVLSHASDDGRKDGKNG